MSEWKPIATCLPATDVLVLEVVPNREKPMIYSSFGLLGIPQPYYGGKLTHWMELPPPPKKRHDCTDRCNGYMCEENNKGYLIFYPYYPTRSNPLTVDFCPICGKAAEENDG